MGLNAVNLFKDRQPGPNRAYLIKDRRGDRLSLTDSQSRLLGVDESAMCATFVISTDDPDRVDDVVTTKGIYLDNFKANPIAFYGHQAIILPVGVWEERDTGKCTIKIREHEAQGTCYFSQRARDAEQVFILVADKILRATSIGFNPMEEPTPRDSRKSNPLTMQRGYVFPKVDLLEVSIVGIPAQPTATLVREVLSKNRLGSWPIVPALRKSLKLLSEPDPVWSNGADPMSKKWGKTAPKKGKGAEQEEQEEKPKACTCKNWPKIKFRNGSTHEPDCPIHKSWEAAGGFGNKNKTEGPDGLWVDNRDKMEGSDGTAGGYTEDEDMKGKKSVQKQPPPPPPKRGGQDQAPRDQPAADEQPEQQPAPYPEQPEETGSDPKEVLGRLVDALTDYLEITKPATPDLPEEVEEEEEPDDDMPDQQQTEEPVGDERYQFRARKPAKVKGKYHSAGLIKRCKDCMKGAADHLKDLSDLDDGKFTKTHKTASLHHHKELMGVVKDMDNPDAGTEDEPGAGEGGTPAEPVQKRKRKTVDVLKVPSAEALEMELKVESILRRGKVEPVEVIKAPTPDELDLELNADDILRELLPVTSRVKAVENAWNAMNGEMP